MGVIPDRIGNHSLNPRGAGTKAERYGKDALLQFHREADEVGGAFHAELALDDGAGVGDRLVGDADRLRTIFADSITDNALDLNTRLENGKIYYSFPVAVLVSTKP